ncbi:MAG: ATP phosphoribosyltransferase regulatory subunit [Patescibacteria group bacterium]
MEEKAKKLSTESYKGVRDFYPEDMAVQNYIFSTWRKIVEESGYVEYSASILEYADLYRSKGSDEIVNEQMYTFTDKGDREVALRPEMTPSLARMIAAKRRGLKLPLRWYSIPNVFRYERPQRGRRREHWQLNCDLMGIAGIEAEVEIISLAHKIMTAFGAKDEDFEIRINSRKTMFEVYQPILKDLSQWTEVCRFLDRRPKMTEEEQKLGNEKYFTRPFNEEDAKKHHNNPSLIKLGETLKSQGVKNVVHDMHLMRGFDYYTDIVFEVFDTNPENKRSLFGGGRYDNLLEMFGVEPVATVGFGMGDITIHDFLETHKLPLSTSKKS